MIRKPPDPRPGRSPSPSLPAAARPPTRRSNRTRHWSGSSPAGATSPTSSTALPRPNTYATWQDGESADEVALTVPARPGRYPLVIYLLALGEGRTAGEAWRSAWAWAGYMVLALQQLARRQAANEAPLKRADLSRVALAGFDP